MWLHSQLILWGGGTRFIFEVIKRLSKKHEITLFLQKSDPEISNKFKEIPIEVKTLSNSSTGDLHFWLNFNRQLEKETKYLKGEAKNYDIVISSFFPMNIVANLLDLPHIQYCFEPFAFFWDRLMIKNLPFLKRIFLNIMRWRFGKKDIEASRKSTKILTVKSGVREWISRIYGCDSIITLLGVDTSFFKKTEDRVLREKYQNKKIIIHSTDWTPLKRTNWLIDQFIEISSEIDNVVLLITEILSYGKERDEVIKKINSNKLKNIELCGLIPFEHLPSYYSLANVGVYAGIGEGASAASLFVLECMACETPVIRTNETDEEVMHEKTGYLFDKDNVETLRKYVIQLLQSKELEDEFGKNARNFIMEKYSWEKVAEIFEKECLKTLNGS